MVARGHWDDVWTTRSPTEVSWHQAVPEPSLSLVRRCTTTGAVIDVGGGASMLAARLVELGHNDVTVLDIAPCAEPRPHVTYVVADMTDWQPNRTWNVWHDRAAFHFLVSEEDRVAYVEAASRSVIAGGSAVIATFAPDGPEQCSGLPVVRYNTAQLVALFSPQFEFVTELLHTHSTPWQSNQSFLYVTLRRC
jgi:uncharacterized UPF0146 family protein